MEVLSSRDVRSVKRDQMIRYGRNGYCLAGLRMVQQEGQGMRDLELNVSLGMRK